MATCRLNILQKSLFVGILFLIFILYSFLGF